MRKRACFLVALLAAVCSFQRGSQAEELHLSLPSDVKFVVRVDLPAVRSSAVTGPLLAMLKEQVLGKLAEKKDGKGLSLEKIVELLGFDPFEEVQAIVVAAADYESPEKSLVSCVQLRKTTGNLEGLLLALPGYKAEEYNGRQIYAATPDEERAVFGAIYVDATGNHTLLLAARREAIVRMLDSLDGKKDDEGSRGGKSARGVTLGGAGGPLAVVDVFEMPAEVIKEEGPPANVAKIMRSLSVRISEKEDKVGIAASVVADAEKQAEQLEQMAKGLRAMVDLALSADAEDEDLQNVQRWLKDLAISRKGATLELTLHVPAEEVRKLIADNLIKD
jgi:hypothetical protein